MTKDIVTQLRDIASLRGDMSGKVIPTACTEAADEIERLRSVVAMLADTRKVGSYTPEKPRDRITRRAW